MPGRDGHGWWPYWLPLFSFLALAELGSRVPEGVAAPMLGLKVLVPGVLFLAFWRRGSYPELTGTPARPGPVLADVAVGVAGAALWMAPYVLLPRLAPGLWSALPELLRPSPEDAFDPAQLGAGLEGLALALRVTGFALVTPFVEELFVRSWLARYADVFDRPVDFRDVPLARFTPRSFGVVVLFFTASHVPWEWPVAVLWIVGTQLWFYRRRQLGALVVVHASSNLAIFLAVVLASGRFAGPNGAPLDLWFFL